MMKVYQKYGYFHYFGKINDSIKCGMKFERKKLKTSEKKLYSVGPKYIYQNI